MSGPVRWLPFAMFLVFAGYWSAVDVIEGPALAILPSIVVGAALVVRALWGRRPDLQVGQRVGEEGQP